MKTYIATIIALLAILVIIANFCMVYFGLMKDERRHSKDWYERSLWKEYVMIRTILFPLMVYFAATMIVCLVVHPKEVKRSVVYESEEIYSISLGSSMSGTFILGTGTVSDSPVYYYYAKNGNGIILRYAYARNCAIKLDDRVPPSIKIPSYQRIEYEPLMKLNPIVKCFAWCVMFSHNELEKSYGQAHASIYSHDAIITLPTNSIQQKYDINL